MDDSYIDRDPSWMATADVEELRMFMRLLESKPRTEKVCHLFTLLGRECDRRAAADYETRGGGEWI